MSVLLILTESNGFARFVIFAAPAVFVVSSFAALNSNAQLFPPTHVFRKMGDKGTPAAE
jgi:hypothetical protein